MPLPLANLDDRRWPELVEEGRTLLPLFARAEPRWTDHNLHDPGITLLELFAWLAEMDIYRLSRIPERHRRKFLALTGFSPRPPQAARTVLSFKLKAGALPLPLPLPAGAEFAAASPDGEGLRFRTLHDLDILPLSIAAVLVDDGRATRDRTRDLAEGLPVAVFGDDPQPDPEQGRPAFYLGLREAPPPGVPFTLHLDFTGPEAGEAQRRRILEEARLAHEACRRPEPAACPAQLKNEEDCPEFSETPEEPSTGQSMPGTDKPYEEHLPPHHAARIVWEVYAAKAYPEAGASGRWLPAGEVVDDTRSLTLDGTVRIILPNSHRPARSRQGPVREALYYLRCRFVSGEYDAPPRLLNLLPNSVTVEQAVPAGEWRLEIARGAPVSGPEPQPGRAARLRIHLDPAGRASGLYFEPQAADLPEVTVLEYLPPTVEKPGCLVLELERLGTGWELPNQVFNLQALKVQPDSLRLFTLERQSPETEETHWRLWTERHDLDASTRTGLHFTLDADRGEITGGDGERGRLFPRGAIVLAAYRSTAGADGNLAPGKITALAESPHNRALLPDRAAILEGLEWMGNRLPAEGGEETESLEHATGRAIETLWAHERLQDLCERFTCQSLDQVPRDEILAVQAPPRAANLIDFERLALDVPGAYVRRARAWADFHPAYPCLQAPGVVTVVIIPSLPARRPQPGPGLLAAVRRYLHRRRTLTTRLEIIGPTYLEVRVRSRVQALAGASPDRVRLEILRALDSFLSPQPGDGSEPGWPFGRDVYRAEVLQVIDGVAGVDHVASLELIPGDGEPQCGNLRLCPTWLAVPGEHEIEVLRG